MIALILRVTYLFRRRDVIHLVDWRTATHLKYKVYITKLKIQKDEWMMNREISMIDSKNIDDQTSNILLRYSVSRLVKFRLFLVDSYSSQDPFFDGELFSK